jgi:heme-degrading monooxygenase HmoA
MIVRTWRGRAATAKAAAYAEHFRHKVLPELKGIAGFHGATLLREDQRGARAGESEFLVLTRWANLEAIRAFAGQALEHAVMEPDAVAALLSFDPTVQHYEMVLEYQRPL